MNPTPQEIYIGKTLQSTDLFQIEGQYIDLNGEEYYRISNYDQMDPFFITVVSDSDHWMYVSSTGSLAAGRVNPENSLFPYYSVDKIHDYQDLTGSKSLFLITKEGKTYYWEPFSKKYEGIYQVQRNIYKNVFGDKLIFEEENKDLGVCFQYTLCSSEKYGIIKKSKFINTQNSSISVKLLDGWQNLLPHGIEMSAQMAQSCLVDAYKKNELDPASGVAMIAMSATLVDRAEPSEALRCSTVWSTGIENPKYLLSSDQLANFQKGLEIKQEEQKTGVRGAFFLSTSISLAKGENKEWLFAAEVSQSPADVAYLRKTLKTQNATELKKEVEKDIATGTESLAKIIAASDGLQKTNDKLSSTHHYANVLFNVMRGGIVDENYNIPKKDFLSFLKKFNISVYKKHQQALNNLESSFHYNKLLSTAEGLKDSDLMRLCYEYLPFTFSRRHGDPSRPWNKFDIKLKNPDGSKALNFQGNWRDIFQNWEALTLSYPGFIESIICKFVNASTMDGYNPYRITKDGIDWEVLEADDPWSNIGYWGDHQIIYLLKFLELSKKHHPGILNSFLHRNIFCYANVPYSIKDYNSILENPHDTIDFDDKRAKLIEDRVKEVGSDGKLVWDKNNQVYLVNLTEKLLASVLSKFSNFIPEAGIWMNTQRPEWNDANNALVGFGVSMVTLYYMRRFQSYCLNLYSNSSEKSFEVSEEIATLFKSISNTLKNNLGILDKKISDEVRKIVMDALGKAGSDFRNSAYKNYFSGKKEDISISQLKEFFEISLKFIDQTIKANKREDGLYHAYNIIQSSGNKCSISHLYEMLEGQVSVLSSGYLGPKEAIELLTALKSSEIYREDQNSYMLYPRRRLPLFLEKNNIPDSLFKESTLLQKLVEDEDIALVEKDIFEQVHFNGDFKNAEDVRRVLDQGRDGPYASLIKKERETILQIFEEIFDHKSFTGRSGTFYGYEGLGSIYWHMVSKLLLAVQENYLMAVEKDESVEIINKLADIYFDVRSGIGFNKSPKVYGSFPTDPYSHTPWHSGAKQPGMTGQVKEEVITRLIEMGVQVDNGRILFKPVLLRAMEFMSESSKFDYYDTHGKPHTISLNREQLAFTYCQVPIIYNLSEKGKISLYMKDSSKKDIEGLILDEEISEKIFSRVGEILKIEVFLSPKL